MAEAEASAQSKGLKKPDFKSIAFTASHPPEAERADYLEALAAPNGSAREDGAQRYRDAVAAWLPSFLDDQVKLNDFGASDYLITSWARTGWTAQLWMARGELYRKRGAQRDFVNSAQFYQNAISLDPRLAEGYRGLGLALIKAGQVSDGQVALKRYLELKPDASDAQMIRLMMPEGTGQ